MARLTNQRFNKSRMGELPPAVAKLVEQLDEFSTGVYGALLKSLTFTENFQAELKTIDVRCPEPTWLTPTFGTDYAAYGTPYDTPGYRILPGGWVQWKGLLQKGAAVVAGDAMVSVPEGYRPEADKVFVIASSTPTLAGAAIMRTDGDLEAASADANYISLEQVCYQAVDPAAPVAWRSEGWPLKVTHGLDKAGGIIPVRTVMSDTSQAESVGQPVLDAQLDGNNEILIKSIYGLTPGRSYRMTLLIFSR
jgi:hypothetical protein